MDISVFGMGYVGAVCAACWSKEGHSVIGVDPNSAKVDLINAGRSPIVETGLGDAIAASVAQGKLSATSDPYQAIAQSSISLVCVGTPSNENGSLNLDYVEQVCKEIGNALRDKDDFHILVMRSTVLPGTARDLIIPTLTEYSGKTLGEGFGVVSNPEFLREGTALFDFYNPPKTVIGESDPRSGETVAALYAMLNAPLVRTDLMTSEMVKYADNAWHATKVAFANEIGNICKETGIDGQKVMDIFCEDTKLNLSSYYLRPGFAFGGSCLPKDVRAICYKAASLDLKAPLLNALLPSNQYQIERALRMVQQHQSKNIGFLGLSFKAGTDDLRESPSVELVERLLGKGYNIKIYDRNVSMATIHGANKDFILHKIPHISALLTDDMDELVSHSDTVVVANQGEEFASVIGSLNGRHKVVDLVRIHDHASHGNYQGICW